jgi:hypothetical protein
MCLGEIKRKFIAFLLVAIMAVGVMPWSVFAEIVEGVRRIGMEFAVNNPEFINDLLEEGNTVYLIQLGTRGVDVVGIIRPGQVFVVNPTHSLLLRDSPEFGGVAASHEPSGELANAIRDFVTANYVNTGAVNRSLGLRRSSDITPEMYRPNNALIAAMVSAIPNEPALAAFGLNEAGMREFIESKRITFFTHYGTVGVGVFYDRGRDVRLAVNYSRNRQIEPRDIDDVVFVTLYEIWGRGLGFNTFMSNFAAEVLGGNREHAVGYWGQPNFEWGLAAASGGAHNVIAAAQEGNTYYVRFVNGLIPAMNPHFNFDYEVYRRARMNARTIQHYTASAMTPEFMDAFDIPGSPTVMNRTLQSGIDNFNTAIDQSLPERERREAAQRFNHIVSVLYNLRPTTDPYWLSPLIASYVGRSIWKVGRYDRYVLSVDLNNPWRGVHSQSLEVILRESAPIVPQAPVAVPPQAPAPAQVERTSAYAVPSAHSVHVNGSPVDFRAFNIHGYNFFMLRDIAYALNGSGGQFEVAWDGNRNAINLLTGTAYTILGGEMAAGNTSSAQAAPSTARVYVNGQPVNFLAYTIDGNNFFRIRDLGDYMGFDVDWDAATSSILVTA